MEESIAATSTSSTTDTNQSTIPTNEGNSNNSSTNIPKQSKPTIDMDITDSEDDSDIDLDKNSNYFANLNVSDRLKNILRYKELDKSDDSDNSDDDQNDSFLKSSSLRTSKNLQSIPLSVTSNNKNNNSNDNNNDNNNINKDTPTITAATKTRLPVLEQQSQDRTTRFQQLLGKLMVSDDSSDDMNDDNDSQITKKKKKKTRTTTTAKKPSEAKKTKTTTKGTTTKKSKKKNNEQGSTIALLDDSSDGSDDDGDDGKHKKLSKKAQLEMYRENQRLKRSAEVKLQPAMNRRTLDDLIRKVAITDLDEEEEGEEEEEKEREEKKIREATEHRDKQLLQLLRSGNHQDITREKDDFDNSGESQDSDDSLVIVGKPEKRGDKILKSIMTTMPSPVKSPWRKMINMSRSPLNQRQYTPINPFSMHTTNNKNKAPMDLRTLNKQLIEKIGKDQLSYRKEMIDRAKSDGLYVAPDERAKKAIEHEHESALLDLEVQQLLFKKTQNKFNNNNNSNNQHDDDTIENELIQLSGDEDDDYDVDYEDEDDQLSLNDNSNDEHDSDSDGPTILKRKKYKPKKSIFLDDEEEDVNMKISKASEPSNSIVNFFNPKSMNKNKSKEATIINDKNIGSKTLTRLMQRTGINDHNNEESQQQPIDDADDEHTNDTEDDLIAADNNNHSENDVDGSDNDNIDKINIQKKTNVSRPKEYNGYFEEEAEEEEDEYFGMGGPDIAETDDLDQFEEDGMLVEGNDENVDASELQAEYNRNMLESDQNMVQKLIKDITSGGLRRKRAAAAAGLLLDDYDLFDDYNEDNDLAAARLREAFKRKKILKGDPLQQLATNPKTAAFAKAAMSTPVTLDLSDDEDNDDTMITDPIKIIHKGNDTNTINNNSDYGDDI